MKLALALLLMPAFAMADGIQVCVDTQGTAYTATVKGFAKKGAAFSGVLSGRGAIADGTELTSLKSLGGLDEVSSALAEDLYYKLKPLVTATNPDDNVATSYEDNPVVYQANGVELLCSSTMSQDEYESLAK